MRNQLTFVEMVTWYENIKMCLVPCSKLRFPILGMITANQTSERPISEFIWTAILLSPVLDLSKAPNQTAPHGLLASLIPPGLICRLTISQPLKLDLTRLSL